MKVEIGVLAEAETLRDLHLSASRLNNLHGYVLMRQSRSILVTEDAMCQNRWDIGDGHDVVKFGHAIRHKIPYGRTHTATFMSLGSRVSRSFSSVRIDSDS